MTRQERNALMGPPRLYHRVAGILAPLILIGTLIYVAVIYPSLPEQLPTHFTLSGAADGWSSRQSIWWIPIIGILVDIVIFVTGFFPQTWNTGVRVTVFNRGRVYRLLRDLMADMRLGLAALWASLTVWTVHHDALPGWALTAVNLAVVTIPLLRYFLRLIKKR